MNLLLDTHIFLWFISGDTRLPDQWRDEIRSLENEVFISTVSIWEVSIKFQIGKIKLPQPPEVYLPVQRKKHLISSLPLDERSVFHLAGLPLLHRDPFDRMLMCQALEYDLTLVTIDSAIRAYSIPVL